MFLTILQKQKVEVEKVFSKFSNRIFGIFNFKKLKILKIFNFKKSKNFLSFKKFWHILIFRRKIQNLKKKSNKKFLLFNFCEVKTKTEVARKITRDPISVTKGFYEKFSKLFSKNFLINDQEIIPKKICGIFQMVGNFGNFVDKFFAGFFGKNGNFRADFRKKWVFCFGNFENFSVFLKILNVEIFVFLWDFREFEKLRNYNYGELFF